MQIDPLTIELIRVIAFTTLLLGLSGLTLYLLPWHEEEFEEIDRDWAVVKSSVYSFLKSRRGGFRLPEILPASMFASITTSLRE